MSATRTTQQGFAHALLIIGLIVAIVGALGFIFWQNFIYQEKPISASSSSTDTAKKPVGPHEPIDPKASKIYTGQDYIFQYPGTGWKLDIETNEPAGSISPTIKTSNYKPAQGVGISSGALVGIDRSRTSSSIEQDMNSRNKFDKPSDMKKTLVDGMPAYSYNSAYEGVHYFTVVNHNGYRYQITYLFEDGGSVAAYKDGYDLVVASFRFIN